MTATDDVGTPEQCVHCDTRHDANEDFTYRGFHFCINCTSALVSWFMDGGFKDDPEMFDYVLEPGEMEHMTSLGTVPKRMKGEPPGWEGTRALHERHVAPLQPENWFDRAHAEMAENERLRELLAEVFAAETWEEIKALQRRAGLETSRGDK